MKLALALAAAAVLSIAAMGGFVAWRHAHPSEFEQELGWLESYGGWADEIDTALALGNEEAALRCEPRFRELVGAPSTATLASLTGTALEGCRSLRSGITDAGLDDLVADDWYATRDRVLGKLMEVGERRARAEPAHGLARQIASFAGTTPVVLCWPESDWEKLSEEVRTIRDDFWIAGYADWTHERIHLAPAVCDPLKRFFEGTYAPNLNVQSFELAEALVTLAHEAEHLRSPEATEAEVECVALQHVRDLVQAAGRPRSYEEAMAGLAWEVGYPNQLADYRTETCYDGGPLDVRPHSDVWP